MATTPMFDAIIAGGGPAGLNAALVLGGQRRRVLLVDAGEPRNATARSMHGFLSRDGADPGGVRRIAESELDVYGTIERRDGRIRAAGRAHDDRAFVVTLDGGEEARARKLLLATGVVDDVPAIEGLKPLWGRSVFHCRICDGWLVRDQPVAVLGAAGADQTGLIVLLLALKRLTSDVVLCTNGMSLEAVTAQACAASGIAVRQEAIVRLGAEGAELREVIFERGQPLARRAAFVSSTHHQASDLAAQLGCKLLDDGAVEVDDLAQTSVRGVYAAGDMARRPGMPFPYAQVVIAAGFGVVAAVAIDLELLRESAGV
jgi:thioredoxin reductase